jgi:predicted deacetylase
MSPIDALAPALAQERQLLCVSIHDVAPATWLDCLRLVQAIRAVADIPLTWLVVPHYHFRPERSAPMEACLDASLARGDELCLHGYSHLDTEAGGGGLRSRFLRNVYTRREGEFAALAEAEARRRLALGQAWFAERGWTPRGFVPPAWLLGEGAWRALRASDFDYTTTFSHFHFLGSGKALLSPSMVYAARNRSGRILSPRVADATAAMLVRKPLVRFSLHPPDARYPELVRHIQQVLERLLATREAVTKLECARRLEAAAGDPAAGDPAAGDPAPGDPAPGEPAAGTSTITSRPRSHPASGPGNSPVSHTVHNAVLRPSY